jgi:hypothetical protein
MADLQISDLPAVPSIASTDVIALENNATTTFKGTFQQITNFINANLASPQQTVYVAENGADVVGNGDILTPYLTLPYALSQITDATTSKPYKIITSKSNRTFTATAFKPNIEIDFDGSDITFSGAVTLDSGWTAAANSFLNVHDANSIDFTAGANLDFGILSAVGANFILQDIGRLDASSFNAKGNTSSITTISFRNVKTGTTPLGITVQQANGVAYNVNANVLEILVPDPALHDYQIFGGQIGKLIVQANAGTLSSFVTSNLLTDFEVRGLSGGTSQCFADNNNILSSPIVDGLGTFLTIDHITQLPTLLNSGAAVYSTISNGMTANYTPANYTPITAQVQGHLAGIDAALSASPQVVYVSRYGTDTPGNGSIHNTYLTLPYALSQITDATPTKPYAIQLLTDNYSFTATSFKPDVYVFGGRSTVNFTGAVDQDVAWNGSTGSTLIIDDFLAFNSSVSINFTFSSAVNATFIMSNIYSMSSPAQSSISGNLTTADTQVLLENVQAEGLTSTFNLSDINLKINNSFFNTLLYVSFSTSNFSSNISNSIISSFSSQPTTTGNIDFTFIANNIVNFGFDSFGGSGSNSAIARGNKITTITLNGINTSLDIDNIVALPTLLNSAQIIYSTIANGITANYTPTNYTAVTPQVEGHLQGIDAAISGGVNDSVETLATLLTSNENSTDYPSGVYTSVIKTLAGSMTIPANTLNIGDTLELTVTGVVNSVTTGGTAKIRILFGGVVLAESVTASSTTNQAREFTFKWKLVMVTATTFQSSCVGWYESPSHTMKSVEMYILPAVKTFDPTVNNTVALQNESTYAFGNFFGFIAVNLNLVKYKNPV